MTDNIEVRDSETDPMEVVFSGDQVSFAVEKDLLDYPIQEEIKQIADLLQKIQNETNAVAVKDLMKDIHYSLQASDQDLNL